MLAGMLKVLKGLPEGRNGGSWGMRMVSEGGVGAVEVRGAEIERFRRFEFAV